MTAPGRAAARPAPSTRDTFTQAYTRAGGSTRPTRQGTARAAGVGAAAVDNGAGFILALMFWGWVALPFLRSGPAGVRNTLRAKFFNKAADGSWLP